MKFFFVSLFIVAALISCSKDQIDDGGILLKEAYVQSLSTPISAPGGVTPVILAVDKPKGGNVSCTDVEQAFDTDLLCGVKIDYISEEQLEGAFPAWLNVDLNGIYVSFSMDGCATIDGKQYKVGAVIVKGSNAANVYYYPDGALSDGHLAAPGDKYMVSNLTFLFVECKEPDLVIALKAGAVAVPSGADGYVSTTNDGVNLGYYSITPNVLNTFKVYYYGNLTVPVGDMTVRDYVDAGDGIRYIEVIVDNKYRTSILFYQVVYLYIGLADGFTTTYTSFPFTNIAETFPSSTMTFKIPYSDI